MAKIIPVASFECVVVGATGDLTMRKLLPALYYRFRDEQMPHDSRIIGAARSPLTAEEFRGRAMEAIRQHVPERERDEITLHSFIRTLTYVHADGASGDGFDILKQKLDVGRIRVFYMATSPDLYGPICHNLKSHGLITALSRVVLEKPIGKDLASAQEVNNEVGEFFTESQTYRIDHYLGKETVQNLLALRFANSIFERLWNTDVIDHVQITVAETVGVEGRGDYYDKSGALRDMLQNHMLQLLCLVAMEPPNSLEANAVRDEKLKVLRALKPLDASDFPHTLVRGQYSAGVAGGASVAGYLADLGPDRTSDTETFVALKAEVRTWRWGNVPFYMRTGKRLPQKMSEIVIQFRHSPFFVFPRSAGDLEPNKLVIRLQPEEGMRLDMMTKDPGPGGMRLRPAHLNISFEEAFQTRYPDAYERLLMDTVRGAATLFMRRDEVEAAWNWVAPILDYWSTRTEPPRVYPAGSWGPTAAIAMIERDGRTWHEEYR